MRFSEREERKLRQLATEQGMRASPDCVMSEGTFAEEGILIELDRGSVWMRNQWIVVMGLREYVVGYDRDNQVMAYADAGADCRLQRVTDLHRF